MPKDEDAAAWTVGMTEEADGTFKLEIVDDGDGLGARPAPAVAATQSAVWPVFGALCALALALLLVGTAMPLLLLLLPMLMLPPPCQKQALDRKAANLLVTPRTAAGLIGGLREGLALLCVWLVGCD